MSHPLLEQFAALPDPRVGRTQRHLLLDILVIALCASICGADDFVAIARYGRAKEAWFKGRLGLDLPGGIPSHDTFGRVFARLDPDAFGQCFLSWTRQMHRETEGQVIALDGKTLRRSFDAASGKGAIHMVSAWASDSRLVLGQVKVEAKSNEITALPKLLTLLDLAGCVVTADAMGCQRALVRQITEQKGDYVLALCWRCAGAVLALCWRCAGAVLALCWRSKTTTRSCMMRCAASLPGARRQARETWRSPPTKAGTTDMGVRKCAAAG